jgi:hypothetical protein
MLRVDHLMYIRLCTCSVAFPCDGVPMDLDRICGMIPARVVRLPILMSPTSIHLQETALEQCSQRGLEGPEGFLGPAPSP